jgi:predicted DNA-binding protein
MSRFTIDFSEAEQTQLDTLAKEKGISKAQVIRNALEFYRRIRNEMRNNPFSNAKVSNVTDNDEVLSLLGKDNTETKIYIP